VLWHSTLRGKHQVCRVLAQEGTTGEQARQAPTINRSTFAEFDARPSVRFRDNRRSSYRKKIAPDRASTCKSSAASTTGGLVPLNVEDGYSRPRLQPDGTIV
jgi:hypothetical protein